MAMTSDSLIILVGSLIFMILVALLIRRAYKDEHQGK